MVTLGHGQVILGGIDDNDVFQSKIYFMKCSRNICDVTLLEKKLQRSRMRFIAIPIPDKMSGCISESKFKYLF